MKKFLAVMMLCAVSALGAAPSMFFVDGSTSWERGRIERLEHNLNFTKVAMPDTWNIHIIPEEQFQENIQIMHVNTESAYTFMPLGQTYINEGYLGYADDRMLRHTLAHEAGHMICECTSEQKANAIAYVLEN
jgi:hypothetical protein